MRYAPGRRNKIKATSRPLMFDKIRQRFPILNIEWLKTGEGDMLLPEHPAITDSNEINISVRSRRYQWR